MRPLRESMPRPMRALKVLPSFGALSGGRPQGFSTHFVSVGHPTDVSGKRFWTPL